MLNVGLTGNIAAGKSTVVGHFAQWGATVIDADALAREIQVPGSPVFHAIRERFGEDVLLPDGTLNRPALRGIVTADAEALMSLNAIVHPAVGRRRTERLAMAEANGDLVVISDIPLLFEALDPSDFDLVVLVDAPEASRRTRLIETRGLKPDEADQLIAIQMPAVAKRPRSSFVIDNAGSLEDVEGMAWAVWCAIRREAAARLVPHGSTVLAMFAHPDDEAIAAGGTLARYADAGAEVHLWCATHGESGTLDGARVAKSKVSEVRRMELERSANALGLSTVHYGGFPDAALDSTDRRGRTAVAETLQRLQPDVVVTFGADGVTGHPDHLAVHAWVTEAWRESNLSGRLFYVTYPEDIVKAVSPPTPLAGRPEREIVARIDIRPWRRSKRAAVDAHASQTLPALDRPPGDVLLDREWFMLSEPTPQRFTDLFQHMLDTR